MQQLAVQVLRLLVIGSVLGQHLEPRVGERLRQDVLDRQPIALHRLTAFIRLLDPSQQKGALRRPAVEVEGHRPQRGVYVVVAGEVLAARRQVTVHRLVDGQVLI